MRPWYKDIYNNEIETGSERVRCPNARWHVRTGSLSPEVVSQGIGRTVRANTSLNHDNNMTFSIHTVKVNILYLKANMVLEAKAVSCATPIVPSRGSP